MSCFGLPSNWHLKQNLVAGTYLELGRSEGLRRLGQRKSTKGVLCLSTAVDG